MATYPLPPQAVVEVQILGTLHGQRTRNTFHYLYTGSTPLDGPATLDALLTEFEQEVGNVILALQSNEQMCDGYQIQLIHPTRYRSRFLASATPGSVQSSSLPSTSTVVLGRQGIVAGRRYQGRIYVPGVPLNHEDNSKIAVGQINAWTLAAEKLKKVLKGATVNDVFVPVVSKKQVVTGLDSVELTSMDPVLRVQRRRELGVGE
jgi:hypothetical protein